MCCDLARCRATSPDSNRAGPSPGVRSWLPSLIAYSPLLGLGLGQLLAVGRDLNQMELVITAIVLILLVGIAIDLLFFSPLERRVLRSRGLSVDRPR